MTRSSHGLDTLPDEKDWRQFAACRAHDAEWFFPESGGGAQRRIEWAKRVCARCPVQRDCLEYALEKERDFGVWGGLTPEERRWVRDRRQQ